MNIHHSLSNLSHPWVFPKMWGFPKKPWVPWLHGSPGSEPEPGTAALAACAPAASPPPLHTRLGGKQVFPGGVEVGGPSPHWSHWNDGVSEKSFENNYHNWPTGCFSYCPTVFFLPRSQVIIQSSSPTSDATRCIQLRDAQKRCEFHARSVSWNDL